MQSGWPGANTVLEPVLQLCMPMKSCSISLLLLAGSSIAAIAQGTAFNYQGRLNDSSGLANGLYDLRFSVFDSAVGGSQVGVEVTSRATPVNGGLFTAPLDFGAGIFTGSPRWL